MEKRQRFTAEFKREAVRQFNESGKPVTAVARELGVARNKLYEWAELDKKHGAGAFPGRGRKPDDEVAKLKRELDRLREENEILKKRRHTSRKTCREVCLDAQAGDSVSGAVDVPSAGCVIQWLLRMARPRAEQTGAGERPPGQRDHTFAPSDPPGLRFRQALE